MNYIGNKEKLRRGNQKIVYLIRELKESQEETKQVLDDYQDLGKEKYKLECELEKQQAELEEYKKTIAQDNKEYEHMKKSLKGTISKLNAELEKKNTLINEQLKENVKLQKELNEENKRCMILANNDKFKEQIIDLMAKKMAFEGTGKKLFSCDFRIETGECDENGCECCIKQYYEKKVEGK